MILGILAGVGSAALWAVTSSLMAASAPRVDTLSMNAIRYIWGTIAVLMLAAIGSSLGYIRFMEIEIVLALIISSVIGLVIGDSVYVGALRRLGLTRAFTVSLGVFIVLTYLLAIFWVDERVTLWAAGGTILVLVGVYSVANLNKEEPSQEINSLKNESKRGWGLLLLASLLWAIATVWLRDAANGEDVLAVAALRVPAAGVVLMGLATVSQRSDLRRWVISKRDHTILFFAGILGAGAATILFIVAIQEVGAGRAAVTTAIAPIFAVFLGVVFLKEKLNKRILFGVLIASAGIILLGI
tara:strand:- start:3707 stop:4603 length:897 start_codon:yes stop_codon:yes gene_type:complete